MKLFKLRYITIGIILATIISFAVVYAQQISSGGMAVSGTFWQTTQPVSGTITTTPPANASANISQINGVTPSLNTGVRDAGTQRVTIATNDVVPVTGTFWQATQPISIASMPSTPVTGAFFQATQPISATTPLKIGETGSCGTTAVSQAIIAVPTASTAVFTSTTCVTAIYINNTNATAQTITVTDNGGTPLNIVGPALSLPGLSSITIPFHGMAFTTGVKWIAGGTGVTGGIVGYQ